IAQGYFADIVVFDRKELGNNTNNNKNNNHNPDNPYLNLIKSTEGNLKLLIIGGRARYGDPEILRALGLSLPEKIKIEKKEKMIDVLEPAIEYGNLKLSKVRSNLSRTLRSPMDAINRLFMSLQKMKAGEQPLRLIPLEEEDDEINRPLFLANTLGAFRAKNFSRSKKHLRSMSSKPTSRLDPLTMDKDRDFFKQLKENPNAPAYLSKLKYSH
ncbi:MAG: hypothetical protein ACJ71D_07160, partial [Nitrososphaera sp.]